VIHPQKVFGNNQQIHLAAMQEELDKTISVFCLRGISFIPVGIFIRKILRRGTDDFNSRPKEVMLWIFLKNFIVLGQVLTREPWDQWQAR
jgi:hypothetical protein